MYLEDLEIVEKYITEGNSARAYTALSCLWWENPSLARAAMIEPLIGEVVSDLEFPDVWVAILRASDAVEPIQSLLRVMAFVHGVDLWITIGNYNDYARLILNEESWIYDRKDAIIVAAPHDSALALALRSNSKVPTLWTTAPEKATDFLARAREWFSFIYTPRKALVLDLDGTIWNGVIGEGKDGLEQNWALQRVALQLYQKGVILAVCSKNDEENVLPYLDAAGNTLLHTDHLAAWRINWQDKATNLVEIAEELNVGIDSLVFFDNNPRERDWVRSRLPMVAVPELPENLGEYARILQGCLYFEGAGKTKEDLGRGKYYAEGRKRKEAKSAMTLEDFYWSLEQKVKIRPMTEETMPRVAQLLQKTNQFNLTTRRLSEGYLRSRRGDLNWRAYTLEVTDKYGDSGIVGVATLRFHGGQCHIDDFLLSCRAVGRTIETAFLSRLTKLAFNKGAAIIRSIYIPTAKNGIVKDFYAEHGFSHAGDFTPYRKFGEAKGTDWVLLPEKSVPAPPWITYE